jgi:hypothetical protein
VWGLVDWGGGGENGGRFSLSLLSPLLISLSLVAQRRSI